MSEAIEFVKLMKLIQEKLIEIIDEVNNTDDCFQRFDDFLVKKKVKSNIDAFKETLLIISRIECEHHRNPSFFDNIIKIIKILEKDIKQIFTYEEIFDIFEKNRRILFYFFQNSKREDHGLNHVYIQTSKKIDSVDESQRDDFKDFYVIYMSLENRSEKNIDPKEKEKKFFMLMKNEQNISEKLKTGENDNIICKFIREDNLNDFISTISKTNIKFSDKINPSIYETNFFLIEKTPSLIEYAAFFGSEEIFKYLLKQDDVRVYPSIWLYAIHGRNPCIIHLIEEIVPFENKENVINESIKCFHHELTEYLINRHETTEKFYFQIAKVPNYYFLPFDSSLYSKNIVFYLIQFHIFQIVNLLLKNMNQLDFSPI